MKVAPYRGQFTVYTVGVDEDTQALIGRELVAGGYTITPYQTVADAEACFQTRPPHILIFFNLPLESIKVWKKRLPETHFFQVVVTTRDTQELFLPWVTDALIVPSSFPGQWLRSMDRAVEYILTLYRREQRGWDFSDWVQKIQSTDQPEAALAEMNEAVQARVPGAKSVFLKYLLNRRLLVATHGNPLGIEDWKGRGLNLSALPEFRESQLLEPEQAEDIMALATEILGAPPVYVRSVHGREQVIGLYFLAGTLDVEAREDVERIIQVTAHHLSLLDFKSYLHVHDRLDSQTLILRRQILLNHIEDEIVRSRRIARPVSFLVIVLDQYRNLVENVDETEGQIALRAIAKILTLRSRRLDWIGRLSENSIGILLPHAPMHGALTKAGRIRRMVELADFKSVLRGASRLTVSIGASEYPSGVRDAEDLLSSAERAVYELSPDSPQRICVAAPVDGFCPDFQTL